MPDTTSAVAADPAPSPSPADETPSKTSDSKRKKIASLQMGIASTIKNNNLAGSAAPLLKKSLVGQSLKDKLG